MEVTSPAGAGKASEEKTSEGCPKAAAVGCKANEEVPEKIGKLEEATPGFEPGMSDLQSDALSAWPRRLDRPY